MTAAHPYAGDGVPDHTGRDRCAVCGLPQTHKLHNLAETPAEVKAIEARRLGEAA